MTVSPKQLRSLVRFDAGEDLSVLRERPKTRGECCAGERPCPWVGCRFNLYLDVDRYTGSIKLNYPHVGPEDMEESCALDVADAGGVVLDTVGKLMNITRERVRQIQDRAMRRLTAYEPELGPDFDGPTGHIYPGGPS